ncbi:1-deoxy-D-xylulose-5-phosphate reductoisomerase [Buchnera aphidicola]|jgi:1-deoxy-D-xylulose-5-phosphate reductoisomerase|uniref:1-deoxy-D-xylulose 5-phosphate reductoisomerase n=1 Tax=Buchnera aphidicola subsp. Schizaphis graminum (strain Sg) TaxID=198804 RepID=DXR_BUCAP|nr:1-deoxy-D-xylulose-5-phosphate reductoisomerase [Buchnera aphidicola]Q8K9S7.1 RecName: Full=1-deoxy-D-xylulose 5-phosphate reductoisomerase; Short=DXP reductoisomerase; AltName: Full=1-deoxyxylulose-5-phosphate reductoisomerase; AltName: Full=2-C-methyl-D-erythritol 4-phosphate synthase [Buchnera aphidicola str. Sg (Schizaphis graminum)]AAM67788.1 1-deoxy-d-xylulose 5-phosphate reductoisomerase [Buchnera aphidicola str. Sg (Schizaphis graminum)]AWI49714.1 1-deoxy-D-xylulose-5-phosphate reduct
MKKITVLGSTGSIGISTLSIVKNNPSLFKVIVLVANKNSSMMLEQCEYFSPDWAIMKNKKSAHILKKRLKDKKIKTQVLSGNKAICQLAALKESDLVISAIVGMAGLLPTLSAINAGKTILLANKESLIVCGIIFMKALSSNKAKIFPIDSEHNAIFQVLPKFVQKNLGKVNLKKNGVKSIILTASGGPFYNFKRENLSFVTPLEACSHPNWSMGRKISIDSATMINKGFEYAEARLLFNASSSEIDILIHPQSIIHSMVEYIDGTILAQLSVPDMKVAISYAMSWPNRISSGAKFLNFNKLSNLSFFKPDFIQFPCLKLAIDAFSQGQAAMTVLNAVNEVTVSAFLDSKISFNKISEINTDILMSSSFSEPVSVEEVLEIDKKTRIKSQKKISSLIF